MPGASGSDTPARSAPRIAGGRGDARHRQDAGAAVDQRQRQVPEGVDTDLAEVARCLAIIRSSSGGGAVPETATVRRPAGSLLTIVIVAAFGPKLDRLEADRAARSNCLRSSTSG